MSDVMYTKHQTVMKSIYFLVIVNVLFSVVIVYLFKHQKLPEYRAVYHAQGKNYLIAMQPLLRPVINREALLEWASRATVSAYTYDVAHYQQQFQNVTQKYFTKDGGKAFLAALTQSGAISNLLSNKLVVTSVVNGAPIILHQGLLWGRETWRVQVPLLVNYQSASESKTTSYVVSLLIVLTDPSEQPEGVGISQFEVYNGI